MPPPGWCQWDFIWTRHRSLQPKPCRVSSPLTYRRAVTSSGFEKSGESLCTHVLYYLEICFAAEGIQETKTGNLNNTVFKYMFLKPDCRSLALFFLWKK